MRVLLLTVIALATCATPPAPVQPAREASTSPPASTGSPAWDCRLETLRLPGGDYVYEVQVAPRGTRPHAEVRQEVRQRAMQVLRSRVCGTARCPEVVEAMNVTNEGTEANTVCAVAAVSRARVRAWRTPDMQPFLRDLDRALARLFVSRLGPPPTCDDSGTCAASAGSSAAPLSVAAGRVLDAHHPGGARAQWLRDQLLSRLSRWQGAVRLERAPTDWTSPVPPPGADVLLGGELLPLGEEGASAVFTVSATFREPASTLVSAPISVSASALPVPAPTSRFPVLTPSEGVSVSVEAEDGNLCPGERFQVTVALDRRRFVRVFNLFGKDRRAVLVYPHEQLPERERRGELPAGRHRLGLGFEAFPLDTDGEGYLVVAADSEEALGELQPFTRYCRVDPATEARLWSPQAGLDARLDRAFDGYRILSDGRCPASSQPSREQTEAVLAAIPACPRPSSLP